ncbi:hypothetical protein AVEN_127857-1 [Araneus ventricosus]|uniref:CCHC-type domain-containing protein n=1 Tax=Araneus ventricosus TaxID=182803 RepID=A0A4Y1ZYK9_ARAVE|nr:hypothetical protein AVEN_127857-1 [Araneus ventricosus]
MYIKSYLRDVKKSRSEKSSRFILNLQKPKNEMDVSVKRANKFVRTKRVWNLNDTLKKRQDEVAERRRQDEIQIAEQKRQEEIELRKLEYEERKRKDEMEFELQKIRLGVEDEWSKLNSPDDLVEKLDDYDTLRSTFRSKQPRKECQYDKQNSFKDDSVFTTNEKRKLYGITHIERGEPKCFHCSNLGHIARNCLIPKSVLTCREGNETGLKIINCVAKETKL